MSVWTEDRIARLKTLWSQGWSAQRIADTLGEDVTRSAVLGKVYRMKLSLGRSPAPRVNPVVAAPKGPRRAPGRASRPAPVRIAARPGVAPEAPSFGLATILSVRRCDCRFPYGEPGASAFRLCGRPVARGVFCAAHAEIAYQRRPQSAETLMQLAGLA
ncbi:GcrA family cell cycle regulator [Brevundimonas sp.]|uniref:GcrA family cell cycle regulator n=1 Tax=Brevundimonas sp. TaxID=1871086 RepID=UPI0028A999E6|nr:GcrA family cell cycle regulator [Brevundimonas sp.]